MHCTLPNPVGPDVAIEGPPVPAVPALPTLPAPPGPGGRGRPRTPVTLAASLVLLAACARAPAPLETLGAPPEQAPSTEELARDYAALPRSLGGREVELDPAASIVRIHVFRAGRAARLGHNHVLLAPRWRGWLYLPPDGLAEARFDLVFRLDELSLDDPALRAGLGPAFASTLSPEAVAATREHMLGDAGLQAARYPELRVHALHVSGEAPRLAVRVAITLHGVTRAQDVALHVEGLPGHLSVTGSLVLRQTDFGIRPYAVAGGLLAVEDEVVVDFSLAG